MSPLTSDLPPTHSSLQLFEGMKAFRGVDNRIRLFRPMLNMERMHRSADRSCLPVSPCSSPEGGAHSSSSRIFIISLITLFN